MSVQNPAASTSSYSGLATSIVFTPSQGMELVNPTTRSDRVEAANHKWFGDQAGFRSALPPPKK
jgi:U4/U6 small nuclear ribonucleoprotein PRP31